MTTVLTTIPTKLEPLMHEDYERIKGYFASHEQYRYVLLTQLLYNTGLRIAEALRIERHHVQRIGNDYVVRIVRGKKKKPVWEDVYVNPELGIALLNYASGLNLRPSDRLFNVTDRAYQKAIKRAAAATIGRSANPHQLRALYTRTLVDNGVPLAAASKLLGHESESTTIKHYYEVTRDKRAEIARRMQV